MKVLDLAFCGSTITSALLHYHKGVGAMVVLQAVCFCFFQATSFKERDIPNVLSAVLILRNVVLKVVLDGISVTL